MRQETFSVELWGAAVWLAVGLVAFTLPMLVTMPMATTAPALFETVFAFPLAVWLTVLTARALSRGGWVVHRGLPVTIDQQPSAFWAFTGVAIVIAGVFLAGFMRGLLSLIALA